MIMNWLKKYRIRQAQKKKLLYPFLNDYVEECIKIDKNKLLTKIPIVVFDTETTGLDAKKDKIISIAGIKIENNQIHYEQSFEALIKQEQIGNKTTTPIHQILSQDLEKAETEKKVLQDWLEFTKGCVLVAHHAQFDVEIVQTHLLHNFDMLIFNPYIDTFGLARRLDKLNAKQDLQLHYHLDALLERFSIEVTNRHTAMGDALATAELFLYLVAKLKERGNKKIKDYL